MKPAPLPAEARRAVTYASARGRWSSRWRKPVTAVFPFRHAGYTVTLANPTRPWGRSIHGRGYLTHVVDELYVVWRAGRCLGAAVRWRCGPCTFAFRLLDEPDSPQCPLCTLQRRPAPEDHR